MAVRPSFVPRGLLEGSGYFGEQEDVIWRLATDLPSTIRLARAREQHELAFGMYRLERCRDNSVPDLAEALGQRRESLGAKLSGRSPAQEEDLVFWCWLAGAGAPTRCRGWWGVASCRPVSRSCDVVVPAPNSSRLPEPATVPATVIPTSRRWCFTPLSTGLVRP